MQRELLARGYLRPQLQKSEKGQVYWDTLYDARADYKFQMLWPTYNLSSTFVIVL